MSLILITMEFQIHGETWTVTFNSSILGMISYYWKFELNFMSHRVIIIQSMIQIHKRFWFWFHNIFSQASLYRITSHVPLFVCLFCIYSFQFVKSLHIVIIKTLKVDFILHKLNLFVKSLDRSFLFEVQVHKSWFGKQECSYKSHALLQVYSLFWTIS